MKKILLCLVAASVLAAAVPAMANDNDRNDRGGFKYGPYGQRMGGSFIHQYRHDYGFAFVPEFPRIWHYDHEHYRHY
jgi:hypothetical protein